MTKLKFYKKIEKLISGCSSCEYDEAEGDLINHCEKCRAELMRFMFLNFHHFNRFMK
jgi:hypothetical protein